jgi:hypothetical protein
MAAEKKNPGLEAELRALQKENKKLKKRNERSLSNEDLVDRERRQKPGGYFDPLLHGGKGGIIPFAQVSKFYNPRIGKPAGASAK